MTDAVLMTLNAGSSSIKFAVYAVAEEPEELARGQVSDLGPNARLELSGQPKRETGQADHAAALTAILDHAGGAIAGRQVAGVGHRIVHGGTDFTAPQALDADAMAALRELEPLAPLHQPYNLAAVEVARRAFPQAVQIGCFDTAFHRKHPWVNDTFALPRRYYDRGVRRYGFHGLSYDYVAGELARTAPEIAQGRVVVAHLGNGASLCGLHHGRSVASTMGFSPLDGLAMGTRTGQIDPGVLLYLLEQGMSVADLTRLLYRESGLLGLSGLSNDMRALEASDNPEAAEAIQYFVARIRREVAAMAADLGGLQALVFCGGIGEKSATTRAGVCAGLEWLGVTLDTEANAGNADVIGTGDVAVRIVPTDEERVIARAVANAVLAG